MPPTTEPSAVARFVTPLRVALAVATGALAVIAGLAAREGSEAVAALAAAAAMATSASALLAWRGAQRVVADLHALESARQGFQEAVAHLGTVARLTEPRAGERDRTGQVDRSAILEVVCAAAQKATGAQRVIFFEYARPPGRLVAHAASIHGPVGAVLTIGTGLAGAVAASREPALYPGGPAPAVPEPEMATAMAVPFFSRTNLLGVVATYGRERPFTAEDLQALVTLITQAGTTVDNVSLHDETQRLSITDGLTGLWNRRQLELRCQEEIERANRFGRPVGVVFCDVDRFKSVNDDPEWLHAGGDAVLVEVAQRLAAATREIDVVARWGGEEFVLLLPETDLGGTLTLAEKVRQAVAEEEFTHAGKSRTVTISLGVASYPHSGANVRTLLEAANEALHRAKHGGRNRVEQAEPRLSPMGGSGALSKSKETDTPMSHGQGGQ